MEINLIFLISVIPAIILFGIAKSGLGGSIALISIPLMTLSMSLTEALAIMLPILIFSDFIAVYRFRKNYDLETLKLIIPSAAIGIIIGSLTFSYFSEDLLKFLIGLMGFIFAGHYFIFKKNKITLINGWASFIDKNTISVDTKNYAANYFVIATGSEATSLKNIEFDEKGDLSKEIREAYSKNGFYIFENVIDPNELEDIKKDLEQLRENFPTGPETTLDETASPRSMQIPRR